MEKRVDENVRQLTEEDLYNAESIDLYCMQTMYVKMPGEYPYYVTGTGLEWGRSDKLDEYYESELMMSYLDKLSPETAIELLNVWKKICSNKRYG
ncbi:MAG: hypothetical protein IJI78_04295 [Oscillospiraceae bacterium]|nr:hypothetical protein [Oscillospiraceae bacterium]